MRRTKPIFRDATAQHLAALIERFAKATNRADSTVSRLATGSGDTLSRLRSNKRITTVRAAEAFQWLADHWPEGTNWPSDIPRPQSIKPKKEGARAKSEAFVDAAIKERRAGVKQENREELVALHMEQPATVEKLVSGMHKLDTTHTRLGSPPNGSSGRWVASTCAAPTAG